MFHLMRFVLFALWVPPLAIAWDRLPVIRRLYGEANSDVRRNVAHLEERMYRFQTGLPSDPDHIVPYENHPYSQDRDDSNNRRRAEEDSNPFKPIRIHFETQALDNMRSDNNAAKIDWYKNVVLPRTGAFWEKALSVVPVSEALKISKNDLDQSVFCGDQEFTRVPQTYIDSGIDNIDLILFVSGSPSTRFCASRTLAVAVACNFDQFDRPTAGAINVCLDNIELNSDGSAPDAVTDDYEDVTVHEVGHVLGMSSNSYRFFYSPDNGKPRTSRPFSSRTVTCVDGTVRSQILPGESTMVFGSRQDGTRYASIVTEKVRAIARNQFDCQSLEGASLENQPTRSDSCSGDHWDERLYYPESMSGVISPTTNILSSLTLALMEDSGWYKANYTVSRMSPWGLGAGCDFVEKDCLTKVEGSNPLVPDYSRGFFCASEGEKACSSELTHKMACQVINYMFMVDQSVPPENQFFPTDTLGGPRQADYCPVYGNTYQNLKAEGLDCKNPANTPSFPNAYNEKYGPNSKCLESSSGEGRCFESFCVKEDRTFRFNIGGKFYICERDFQTHTIPLSETTLFRHTITCPRLSQACPDLFCPFNCAGRGICNYTSLTINGTNHPKCECFDPSDNSEACSDSLVPDGGFLDDAGTLLDNLEENFFDPLIAIFVDNPEDWTTASWAWAAGLLSIGLILVLCVCSSLCPAPNSKKGGYGATRHRPVRHSIATARPQQGRGHHYGHPGSSPTGVRSSRLYNV